MNAGTAGLDSWGIAAPEPVQQPMVVGGRRWCRSTLARIGAAAAAVFLAGGLVKWLFTVAALTDPCARAPVEAVACSMPPAWLRETQLAVAIPVAVLAAALAAGLLAYAAARRTGPWLGRLANAQLAGIAVWAAIFGLGALLA